MTDLKQPNDCPCVKWGCYKAAVGCTVYGLALHPMTTETANRILLHRDPKGAIFFQPEFEELVPMAKLWLMLPDIIKAIEQAPHIVAWIDPDGRITYPLLDRLKALENE